jgi:hypothetical protein
MEKEVEEYKKFRPDDPSRKTKALLTSVESTIRVKCLVSIIGLLRLHTKGLTGNRNMYIKS